MTVRPKGTEIRFSEMILVATPIESNHHIIRNELVLIHTAYKDTRGKVCSIYPSLVWHDTENKKKKKKKQKGVTSNTIPVFVRKRILSALPSIATQRTTTTMDPVTKTVYGKIKIGVANNTYDELSNNDYTTPRVYKTP